MALVKWEFTRGDSNFAVLMKHLQECDSADRTVLMVQVENEAGMIPESRDHSALANAAFPLRFRLR